LFQVPSHATYPLTAISFLLQGSIAAAWQAAMGNVAAGSMFAGLQSLGAVGLNAGVAAAIGGGAAAGTAIGTEAEVDTNVLIVDL